MFDSRLIDPFGRRITYLRLSMTDRYDSRYTYCTNEDMQSPPRDQIPSLEELYAAVDAFIGSGVWRIRITGGEPLVHKDTTGLLARLGQHAELENLAITINSPQLYEHTIELRATGVCRPNVNLDSLQYEHFAAFTHSDRLEQVLSGIRMTREAGLKRIKLDCVVQEGRNDDEIPNLVEYAPTNQLDINFIEEMPPGSTTNYRHKLTLRTGDEVRVIIERRWSLTLSLARSGGPSRYYQIGDEPSRIGLILPHSNNLYGDYNRMRVTAESKLVLCLGHRGAFNLRELLRSHPGDHECLSAVLVAALNLKPGRHHFDAQEQARVLCFMSMTGG